MILQHLTQKKVISPPSWLPDNTVMLVQIGSIAYATNTDTSDMDYYGICLPPRAVLFPESVGLIRGFSTQIPSFDQYIQHGIADPDGKDRTYDFQVFNILKFFSLAMAGNPNVCEVLFVPQECISHITQIGTLIRENRKLFLHKGHYAKLKGYSYSQLSKCNSTQRTGKRKEIYEKYGYDSKFLMHTVRLLYNAEMILAEHDLDLRRHKEHLKSIRRGEVSEQEVREWAAEKEKFLENLYQTSTLPWGPPEDQIKDLLLECLSIHYGGLDKEIARPDKYEGALRKVREILEGVGI